MSLPPVYPALQARAARLVRKSAQKSLDLQAHAPRCSNEAGLGAVCRRVAHSLAGGDRSHLACRVRRPVDSVLGHDRVLTHVLVVMRLIDHDASALS